MENNEFSQTRQVSIKEEAAEKIWKNLPFLCKTRNAVRDTEGYCIDNRFIVTMKCNVLSENKTEISFFVISKSFRTTPQADRESLMNDLFQLYENYDSQNGQSDSKEETPYAPMRLEGDFHINIDYFIKSMGVLDNDFLSVLKKMNITMRRVKFTRECICFESDHYTTAMHFVRKGDEDIFVALEHKKRVVSAPVTEAEILNGFFENIVNSCEERYKEFSEKIQDECGIPYIYDEEAIEGYNLDHPFYGEKRKLSFFEKLRGAEADACPRCGQLDAMKTLCNILYDEEQKTVVQTVNERVKDKWGNIVGSVEREQYVPTTEKSYWTARECKFCKYRDCRSRFV